MAANKRRRLVNISLIMLTPVRRGVDKIQDLVAGWVRWNLNPAIWEAIAGTGD
jgi:hypothetical protein